MIKYFYGSFLMISFLLINDAFSSPDPLEEVKPGLFVSSKVVDGKKLYFGLQNKPDSIDAFRNFAYNIGSSSNQSSLSAMTSAILFAIVNAGKDDLLSSGKLNSLSHMGLDTLEKQTDFVNYLAGINKDLAKTAAFIEGIPAGANHANRAGQDMFAWISTKPITDYRDFGYLGSAKLGGGMDLMKAYASNQDVVISVSASINNMTGGDENSKSKLNSYINIAGIFKPPHEMLYGEHKNIALMFHGFIAYASNEALGKKVYYVGDPTTDMGRIMNEAFLEGKSYRGVTGSRQDLFGDIDGKSPVPEGIKFGGFGSPDRRLFASTEALAKFFTESK